MDIFETLSPGAAASRPLDVPLSEEQKRSIVGIAAAIEARAWS
jgi:hypothetical protein